MRADARRTNHMRADVRAIDVYLVEWARWGRDEADRLGLPPETLLGRVIRLGADGAHAHGHEGQMPDEIARVDAAICRLMPLRQQVVKTYYLRWEPVEAMARRCRISRRQFRAELERAQVWLSGALGL